MALSLAKGRRFLYKIIFSLRKADIPNLSSGQNCSTFEKLGHVRLYSFHAGPSVFWVVKYNIIALFVGKTRFSTMICESGPS